MKLMVIDDEVSSLHIFLDRTLGNGKAECVFFQDDLKSIQDYVKNNKVDAAFLDINMPNIDGVSLAQKLIKLQKDIRIVFVTGTLMKEDDLPLSLRDNFISIIYKPYNRDDVERCIDEIMKKKAVLDVRMFDHFGCSVLGHELPFTSSKSKELLALLICYNGKNLNMESAITYLWPDKDMEKAKILYRDAVWRLRKTLRDAHVECVGFQRGALTLDRSSVHCDYYDFLDGKPGYYSDNFLVDYDWSVYLEGKIEALKNKDYR